MVCDSLLCRIQKEINQLRAKYGKCPSEIAMNSEYWGMMEKSIRFSKVHNGGGNPNFFVLFGLRMVKDETVNGFEIRYADEELAERMCDEDRDNTRK